MKTLKQHILESATESDLMGFFSNFKTGKELIQHLRKAGLKQTGVGTRSVVYTGRDKKHVFKINKSGNMGSKDPAMSYLMRVRKLGGRRYCSMFPEVLGVYQFSDKTFVAVMEYVNVSPNALIAVSKSVTGSPDKFAWKNWMYNIYCEVNGIKKAGRSHMRPMDDALKSFVRVFPREQASMIKFMKFCRNHISKEGRGRLLDLHVDNIGFRGDRSMVMLDPFT